MNYVDYIRSRLPARPFKGRLGERFSEFVGGYMANIIAEGASLVVQSVWLIAGQAADVLGYQGAERRLLRYLVETDEQYRTRLQADPLAFIENGIEIWEKAGSVDCLEEQFEAAGYTGARVFSPHDWGRTPLNHITQFWVYLPFSSHADGTSFARCGDGTLCGSGALAGDGTPFGPGPIAGSGHAIAGQHTAGITAPPETIPELRYIAKTFKAGHEVCRQIIVEIDGPVCGTGLFCGTPGLLCGGTTALIGTGVPET